MKINAVSKRTLDRPVVFTLETVEELEWAYLAFSNAVHMAGVEEDSAQQKFYGEAHVALNEQCAPYRDAPEGTPA